MIPRSSYGARPYPRDYVHLPRLAYQKQGDCRGDELSIESVCSEMIGLASHNVTLILRARDGQDFITQYIGGIRGRETWLGLIGDE